MSGKSISRRELVLGIAGATAARGSSGSAQDATAGSKPLTLDRKAIPLDELAARIGAEAGIKIAASPDVAWDRVTLRIKDRTPDKVLGDLAELLNYAWLDEGGKRMLSAGARARVFEENERRRWYDGAANSLLKYVALVERPRE